MDNFKLFDYLDLALVKQESRDPKPSSVPAVWPSEASADRIDKSAFKIVGKCQRQSYLRMTGRPVSNQIDPMGAWKWVTGRMMEGTIVDLAKATSPSVYIANGVKHYVKEFYLPLELDLVVMDPRNKRGWIAECKTYDGYYAEKEIEVIGMPKLENLMQDCIYLLEAPTGKKMKEIIRTSIADRTRMDGLGLEHRNRIEANLEMMEAMDDGPMGAKLIYVSRGKCNRTEFDVSIAEDFDGSHYPVVNGQMYKIFTVESVYERYRTLQGYWFRARREAVRLLQEKGVNPPATLKLVLAPGDDRSREEGAEPLTPEQKLIEGAYIDALNRQTWILPDEFLPPAEYEWAYSAEKIEKMNSMGLLTKKAYDGWKKKKEKVGDWQCLYCPQKQFCVPKQNPNWTYQVADLGAVPTPLEGGMNG
jgi:hypothetical protein